MELKSCPFCGGEAYHYADDNGISVEDMTIEPGVMHYVLCSNCSALVSGRTQNEAADAWNRRADNG